MIKRGDMVILEEDQIVRVVHVPIDENDDWCFDTGAEGNKALIIVSDRLIEL